ncbi:MAG TPA: DUF6359 domain-containing protein [Bacteroidales bacterium]|nr:MAG: hypothetical protein BWX62_01102 [Bacteroidetes bacterium ADurb.Bin037]HPV87770.1 DUF6359 domain-containing protein [Bacteroidales bacterium]HPW77762.1 DUF6359 domain-containing protein [Bacteroidales bacterium]HQB55431.1 DUF6359 domain-containing protein [Bacteroidales bacterium]
MKRFFWRTAGWILLAVMCACDGLKIVPGPDGQLIVNVVVETPFGVRTKNTGVDSYVFLLINQTGDTLYRDTVGAIKGSALSLEPGTYSVVVYNEPFTVPAFDKPHFYGSETAHVIAGESCEVVLVCKQENTGVRVVFSEEFRQIQQNYYMNVAGTGGSLNYDGDTENDWGFFFPGQITLSLFTDGQEVGSVDRQVLAKHMYSFFVERTGTSQENVVPVFTLSVDSTRTWVSSIWNDMNTAGKGLTKETAYSVTEARELEAGIPDIWICGYIIGYYKSSTTLMAGGTDNETNLALADGKNETDINKTLAVNLTAGAIRDGLNLLNHPENLYRKVWLKGKTRDKYFGQPGLENLKEFVLE